MSTGGPMPKTRTVSSGAGQAIGPEFGYRRKVGFETFEKSTAEALFACTLQVSDKQSITEMVVVGVES